MVRYIEHKIHPLQTQACMCVCIYVYMYACMYIYVYNVDTSLYIMSIMKKNMSWILQGMGDIGGNGGREMGINYMNRVFMHEILEKQLTIVKRNTLSSCDCFQMSGLLDSAYTWRLHLYPAQDPGITLLVSPHPYILTPASAAMDLWTQGLSYSEHFPEWNGGFFHVFLCSHQVANHSWDSIQEIWK